MGQSGGESRPRETVSQLCRVVLTELGEPPSFPLCHSRLHSQTVAADVLQTRWFLALTSCHQLLVNHLLLKLDESEATA